MYHFKVLNRLPIMHYLHFKCIIYIDSNGQYSIGLNTI